MLDELASGAPTIGAPDIERAFELRHASIALVIFVVPAVVGFVVEPFVFLASDRYPRKWFVVGGLGAMAAASFVSALAPNAATLSVSIAVWYIAAGASASLSQATLVDGDPEHRARTMTRWTLFAAIGDLVAPLAFGAFAALGLSWRVSFAVVGATLAVWCAAVASRRFPEAHGGGDDEPEKVPLLRALREALRDGVLVLWLFGLALCDLLD